MRVDDVKKHANVLLVDMSDCGARVVSSVMLPPQAGLSFRWVGLSRDPVLVHGHVADMRMVDKRTAEYQVQFNMPSITRERLARELVEVGRRKLFKVADTLPPMLEDLDFARATDRKTYRVVTHFPVTVQAKRGGHWIPYKGEARDLSAGGMMLQLPDELEKGTELELVFTLPSHEHHAPQKHQTKEAVEITPFGERRVRKSSGPKANQAIHVRACIVKQMGNSRSGAPLYGVNFAGVPAVLTDEIARWIHAQQLSQLRSPEKKNGHHKHHHNNGSSSQHRPSPNGTHRSYSVAQRTIQLRQSFMPPPEASAPKAAFLPPRKHGTTWQSAKAKLANLAAESNDVFELGAPTPGAASPENIVMLEQTKVVDERDVFGLGSV